MRIGATDIHTFTLPFDLSTVDKLYVTYQQCGQNKLEKMLSDNAEQFSSDGAVLTLTLTQDDTLLFDEGDAEVEVTVEFSSNGTVSKSEIETLVVERSLKEQAI
jgi:uncharacterized protein YgfB (UPF0149 family)